MYFPLFKLQRRREKAAAPPQTIYSEVPYIPTMETEEEMPLVLNIRITDVSTDNLNRQSDYYQMEITLSGGGCYVILKKAVQGGEGSIDTVLELDY